MLHYSFSTVFMAFLSSSILAALVSIAFLSRDVMVSAGSRLFAVLVGMAALRLLVPFEFPFAFNILLPQSISQGISALQMPLLQIRGMDVSCWHIFEFIWIGGIPVLLALDTMSYFHFRNYVLKYGTDMTAADRYRKPLDRICARYDRANTFRVMELYGLNTPGFLYAGKPYILIPKNITIPADRLHYILHHEALHYFHRDHCTKLAVRLFFSVYWWNPVCIALRKHLNLLLEISVDREVVCNDPIARDEYAACLLEIRKQVLESPARIPRYLRKDSSFFLHTQGSDLKKRCIMLFHEASRGKKAAFTLLLSTLAACTYLVSYLYTVEAHYYPPELTETVTILTPDNTYIIQLDSGEYEIYTDGIAIDRVTCLDFYPSGIKIYNEKGELIDET